MVYIGETGRKFEVGQKEHKKDMKQLEGVKYTRVRMKESLTEIHAPVGTDGQKPHGQLGGCETQSKGTRLEEERGERSHLHQEGRDAQSPGMGGGHLLPEIFLKLLCCET